MQLNTVEPHQSGTNKSGRNHKGGEVFEPLKMPLFWYLNKISWNVFRCEPLIFVLFYLRIFFLICVMQDRNHLSTTIVAILFPSEYATIMKIYRSKIKKKIFARTLLINYTLIKIRGKIYLKNLLKISGRLMLNKTLINRGEKLSFENWSLNLMWNNLVKQGLKNYCIAMGKTRNKMKKVLIAPFENEK